jgi:hypothetical protein
MHVDHAVAEMPGFVLVGSRRQFERLSTVCQQSAQLLLPLRSPHWTKFMIIRPDRNGEYPCSVRTVRERKMETTIWRNERRRHQ